MVKVKILKNLSKNPEQRETRFRPMKINKDKNKNNFSGRKTFKLAAVQVWTDPFPQGGSHVDPALISDTWIWFWSVWVMKCFGFPLEFGGRNRRTITSRSIGLQSGSSTRNWLIRVAAIFTSFLCRTLTGPGPDWSQHLLLDLHVVQNLLITLDLWFKTCRSSFTELSHFFIFFPPWGSPTLTTPVFQLRHVYGSHHQIRTAVDSDLTRRSEVAAMTCSVPEPQQIHSHCSQINI